MTFRERYMAGEAEFDEIFGLAQKWNFSDDPRTLREYLGLTADEEDIWISESDEALEEYLEKEKNRWIFFTDLDGTLLNDEKNITEKNRKTLEAMREKGHVIVLSTGRALPSAKRQAETLGLMGAGCYIVCYNGGQIYDTERDALIYRQSVPMEVVRSVFDDARDFGISIQTYTATHVVTEQDNEDLHTYVQIQDLPFMVVEDVTQALEEEPPKILALSYKDPSRIQEFRSYIEPRCQGKLDLFLSHAALLELVPPGVNKGNAVRFLCGYLGIPIGHSLAAGDAENDLTMIQAAGIGAAMCNGEAFLKEAADYVTLADNNHDGVAEILEKFILNAR